MSAQPVSLLCQYNTGILSPGEEGGREGGGRTEEGGGERRREERRANVGPMRFLRSSLIEKNACVLIISLFSTAQCFFSQAEGVFAGMQQSTVTLAAHNLTHNLTLINTRRRRRGLCAT